MGVWGVGLYSSDFAKDLRAAVKAISRLPFEPHKLLDHLCTVEPSAANDPADPDYTVFWLVAADQFASRGIHCIRARDRALTIIRDGTDMAVMKALGMDDRSLPKRSAMLNALATELATASVKPRSVLKAPEKLLLQEGDVVAYPICRGKAVNPYAGPNSPLVKNWSKDGWGAFVVAECGHEFGYLAWYRPLVACEPLTTEPALEQLMPQRQWQMRNPGTLTARHVSRMQFQLLGHLTLDPAMLLQHHPQRPRPLSYVVNDISLANSIAHHRPDPSVPRIALADLTT